MEEDRSDRFTSEMRVFKTAEEAFAAYDEHEKFLKERREKRRKEKTNDENTNE